jgi:hypothetical protein
MDKAFPTEQIASTSVCSYRPFLLRIEDPSLCFEPVSARAPGAGHQRGHDRTGKEILERLWFWHDPRIMLRCMPGPLHRIAPVFGGAGREEIVLPSAVFNSSERGSRARHIPGLPPAPRRPSRPDFAPTPSFRETRRRENGWLPGRAPSPRLLADGPSRPAEPVGRKRARHRRRRSTSEGGAHLFNVGRGMDGQLERHESLDRLFVQFIGCDVLSGAEGGEAAQDRTLAPFVLFQVAFDDRESILPNAWEGN